MPLDRPLAVALLTTLVPSGLFGLGVATAPPPAPEPVGAPLEDRWVNLLVENALPRRPPDRTHRPDPPPHHYIACHAYPPEAPPREAHGLRPPLETGFSSGGLGGGIALGPIEWPSAARVIDGAAPRLLRCIQAIPASIRSFNLRLNVSDQGAVELARIDRDTGITDDMRDCMLGVLRGLRFPAHPGRGVTLLRYPLDPDLLDDGFRDGSFPGTAPAR